MRGDIIILTKTKRQFAKARKRLFAVLKELRLKISPHKTKMGKLEHSFHFLGVSFEVTRIPQGKNQEVKVGVHKRTSRRALDKMHTMLNDAAHPANMQRYLIRWTSWWHHVIETLSGYDLIFVWVCDAAGGNTLDSLELKLLGRELLPLMWLRLNQINLIHI